MVYRFIDTHCHFDFPPFATDADNALASANAAGVARLIVPAVTADRFAAVCSLSQRHSALYAALGLHPLYIAEHRAEGVQLLEQRLKQIDPKLIAVGEIGLDHYMEDPQPEKQLSLLHEQLSLAKRYDFPVILHSRRTHDILAKILRQAAQPCTGVVHGFAGSLSQAQAFVRAGYYIGVGGTITYERAQKTRATIAALPLSMLLLETDAPDMPVAGYQGEFNRPERIAVTFQALCQLRTEPAQQIAEQLWLNSLTLFSRMDN